MSYGDFNRASMGYTQREYNSYRKLRLLLSAQTGKDARQLITLPGDYDNLPRAKSKEENIKQLKELGYYKILKDRWQKLKN